MINIHPASYSYNNRTMHMYYSFTNSFLIRVMCRVARKLTGSTSRMVPCCSGSGTNPITLSCTISLSAARKWGCDIMTGAPGTGIYSTLISSFSHTYKQRHLNLPNGIFFYRNPCMLYMQCQQKKKIKFGLKLRVGVVFFTQVTNLS